MTLQSYRNELILQTSIDGFCTFSIAGEILEVNPAWCAISGYSKEELVGMQLGDLEANQTPEELAERLDRIAAKGYGRFETGYRRKNGTIVDIELGIRLCLYDDKKFFFAFLRDISDKKRLASQLELYKDKVLDAQRRAYISSMGTIVAHRLSQPLTIINMLLASALASVDNENQCCPSILKKIRQSLAHANEAASIIRRFREHCSQPAADNAATVSVSDTADRIVSMLSEKAKQANISISVNGLDQLPEVELNETALEQVFLIIIQNAIGAARDGQQHTLSIVGTFADNKTELRFTDDCCGIAPKNLAKIFEPFFSTKSHAKGMGLGLDIVRQILAGCGGDIHVESELGKGAAFHVTLPITDTLKR